MNTITIVTAGYEADQLTEEAKESLKNAERIILHTERCGCAEWLREKKLDYESMDFLYDSAEDFDEHADSVADHVIHASEEQDVAYVVFSLRDSSLRRIMQADSRAIRFSGGSDPAAELMAGYSDPVLDVYASGWESLNPSSSFGTLIRELERRETASELKLRLMEAYPEESMVRIRFGDGRIRETELYNLDRFDRYDHKTCVFIPAVKSFLDLERFELGRFEEIIETLLGPDGCPWDRAQTHKTLRPYILEEAYEVIEAVDDGDMLHLCEELGDVLLQIVLHAKIAEKHGEFNMRDVISEISQKMIRRHSHVFGTDAALDEKSVKDLWAKNKMKERQQKNSSELIRDVPKSMPAAMRAIKVVRRIAEISGCQLECADLADDIQAKVKELGENAEPQRAMGDLLLRAVVLCAALDVDPEISLNSAVDRMISRWESLGRENDGKDLWRRILITGKEKT